MAYTMKRTFKWQVGTRKRRSPVRAMAKTRHEDVQSHIRSQPEFEDSERLAVLYSNILPLKERNRTSFDTIVAWWHQLLLSLIPRLSDDQLVLHASVELLDVLAAQDIGRPISLGVVIVRHL